MANYRTTVMDIVGRCRRVGWDVEQGTAGEDWRYRITPPGDHAPVYIHSTPSDVNWAHNTWRKLNAAGFEKAEEDWKAADAVKKANKLAADRKKADAKAERLAKQSAALTQAAGQFAGPQPVDLAWLTTPSEWPETRTVVMTPEAAKLVLDTMNTHNRRMSAGRIAYFEDMIQNNEFGTTHQGIAIDSEGVLQDGQTRLQAIVNSGKSVAIQVSVGMDPKNFMRVDTGRTRSARDTAFIMGETDPSTASAAARMLVIIEREGPNAYIRSRGHVPNERIGIAIESYGDALRAAVREAKIVRRELPRATPSAVAAAIFMIRQRMPEDDRRVEQFIEDLKYGVGINDRMDPVLLLRRNLTTGPSDRTRYYDRWEICALVLKAWNFRANGERRQALVWRRDAAFPASVFLPPPDEGRVAAD